MLEDAVEHLSRRVLEARKKTLGFLPADVSKPVVAICNSYSELNLAHLGFNYVSQKIREGVLMAGGMPIEFGLPAICDSMPRGKTSEKYVLPAREAMADAIEIYIATHAVFDAMVCVGTCDKVLPAILIAAARLNIPTVVVTGGPQIAALNHGMSHDTCAKLNRNRRVKLDPEKMIDEKRVKSMLLSGELTDEEFVELYYATNSNIGICRPYATAGTMNYFTESLGLALTGSALVPELSMEKTAYAKRAGETAVQLARAGIRARDIITRGSLENAIRGLVATGGAMNGVMHALAVANSAGIAMDYEDIERLAETTPFLIDLKNQHALDMTRFRAGGGILGVMKRLGDLVDRNAMTVDGRSLGELIDDTGELNSAIRTREAPLAPRGGIRVLKGSLAPRGALFNVSNIGSDRLKVEHRRRAAVFDSHEQFVAGLAVGLPYPDAAVVIRYEGPKGGPGMRETHRISEVIAHMNALGSDFLLITDGRYSGASDGFIIGYLAPEAAEPGAPLALVEDGDEIVVDIPQNRLDLNVPGEILAERARRFCPPVPDPLSDFPYLARYRRLVGPVDRGAIT
jgi:dihydroxy-acid dehydratase